MTAPPISAVITDPDLRPAPVRGRDDTRRRWQLVVAGIAVAVVLPIALVVGSLVTPSRDVWAYLVSAGLGRMVWTTLALGVVVVLGSTTLGAALAWLVGRHTFPGRR